MSDATRRFLRTVIQLIASGGLTAIVDAVVGGLSPAMIALVLAVWQAVVTYCHNWLEDNTRFPAMLKAPASQGVNPVPPATP